MGSLSIVTNLWHDENYRWNRLFRYTPEHVNRLAAACERSLPPHQFVCFTDLYDTIHTTKFDRRVHLLPMWHWGAQYGGCWRRLKVFDPVIEGNFDGEHILALDLDVVITADLSPLVTNLPDFKAWRNVHPTGCYVCGSMFAWRHGTARDIWDDFDERALVPGSGGPVGENDCRYHHPDAKAAGWYIGSEQTWLSVKRAGCPTWTKADGVYSFRAQIAGKFKRNTVLPPDARIVHFHGPSDPSQYEHVAWIRQHWLGEQHETQLQRAA